MAKGNHYHDNMRNVHVRSRGLIFVAIALTGFGAFSYWGLSTQNNDLLVKIEQLEEQLKMGSDKVVELEEKLGVMAKKHGELQTANAKLVSELAQKETLISAQGEEASQWRDKVKAAESEVGNFKSLVGDKEKEISDLKETIKALKQEGSLKDAKLDEANELIKTLQAKIGQNAPSLPNSNVVNQTSTRTPPGASDSKNVIPKPDNNKSEDVKDNKSQEPVGDKPEDKAAVVRPEEEMELVDPKGNVMDPPEADNDEGKFKEIREEMEMNDADKNNANDIIKEPSLLNSQDDNLDEEPNNHIAAHQDDNNQPEDQEFENEDDRVEK